MKNHFSFYLNNLKYSVERVLRVQCMDPSSPLYGTIEDLYKEMNGAHCAMTAARQLIDGCYVSGSYYEGNTECLERAALAIRYAISLIHEDGTLDLHETNFHDASETAFAVQTIAPSYLLMRSKMGDSAVEKEVSDLLMEFFMRSADGIINGGFHTPNHRWAHSAALALLNEITGRKDCLDRMQQFLNEGIDCNEDGEYTERSSGGYNIVCNRAFIFLSFIRKDPSYLECVKRNLRMVLKYVEPDNTINTMNSTRQDFGKAPDWKIYYSCYLYMALAAGDREFAGIAQKMLEESDVFYNNEENRQVAYFDFMPLVLMDERLSKALQEMDAVMPDMNHETLFPASGIMRYRKDKFSMTLLENQPCFAKLQYQNHTVFLRMSGCFYAKGQFVAETLEKAGTGYVMTYRRRWGYKSPLPEKQDTADWRKMDHSRRADVKMQDFGYDVTVTPVEDGAEIDIATIGVECVPVKLEILLQPNERYETDDVTFIGHEGDYVYQKCDSSMYRYRDYHTLYISGGSCEHTNGEAMRGSLFGKSDAFTVAVTAFTPVKKKLCLRFDKPGNK